MSDSAQTIHLNEGKVYFTPDGGAEVELDVREATLSPRRDLADSTGSKSNGWRSRTPGTRDVSGSLQVYFRRDEVPYDATRQLKPGARGTLRMPIYDSGPEYSGLCRLGEEFSDTIFSNDDVKVIEIPFAGDGEWTFDGDDLA